MCVSFVCVLCVVCVCVGFVCGVFNCGASGFGEFRLRALDFRATTHNASKDRHVGGCQNYGSFLGPYYNTAPII